MLFVDPYHKQVYQLPTDDQRPPAFRDDQRASRGDETDVLRGGVDGMHGSVRGVSMYGQFPVSVVASADQAVVYWIDSTARRITGSHFAHDTHSVVAQLPQGRYAVTEVSCSQFVFMSSIVGFN